MDFDFPPDDDPRRVVVREWLAANPDPSAAALFEAGYVVPHWPEPWGVNADPMHQIIIAEELKAAKVTGPTNPIGIGWAAPTILVAGSDEMKAEYLPKIFTGEHLYCQLFSEPDAGSDLSNLATRAVRDGDEYIVNGSKIWSSGAHHSDMGILIARTDPDVSKHKGLSYFLLPMDSPGVTMTPIVDMCESHSFNQVFFDDVRIPVELRVGEEGDGWRLAKVTLANERVSLSSAGTIWGAGPTVEHLLDLIRENGGIEDRIMGDEHGQHVFEFVADYVGAHGMLRGAGIPGRVPGRMRRGATEMKFGPDTKETFPDVDPIWYYGLMFSPALTIGGGTFAIQRNIVAEHVLGLNRDLNVEKGRTWSETHGAGASS